MLEARQEPLLGAALLALSGGHVLASPLRRLMQAPASRRGWLQMLAVMPSAQGSVLLRRRLRAAGSRRGCPQMLAAAALMLLNMLWLAPQRLVQRQAASCRPLLYLLLGPQRKGQQAPTRQ